jgi:hypothetical protein
VITIRQAGVAVSQLAVLRCFPSDAIARAMLAEMILRTVSNTERLEWLVRVAVANCDEYPGPKQIRALYCTRFKPADGGDEPTCTISGFTPSDSERGYQELQSQETAKQIEAYQHQKLIAAPGTMFTPPPIPEPKRIAPVDRTTEDLEAMAARDRLADAVGVGSRVIHFPGSPKRTDEENARLIQELETRLGLNETARSLASTAASLPDPQSARSTSA